MLAILHRREPIESDPRDRPLAPLGPPWLLAFANLMLVLFCFFVILYALSAALNSSVGEARYARPACSLASSGRHEGIVLFDSSRLGTQFAPGSAAVPPALVAELDRMVPTLRRLLDSHELVVQGHTDDQPVRRSSFRSNTELSVARATAVVEHLAARGLPTERLLAVGHGGRRPAARGGDAAGKTGNRRVALVVREILEPWDAR